MSLHEHVWSVIRAFEAKIPFSTILAICGFSKRNRKKASLKSRFVILTNLCPKFGLGLSFKLWVWVLDRNNSCQSLTNVFTSVRLSSFSLRILFFLSIVVNDTGQSGAEPLFMGSTFMRMNVIRKAHNHFMVACCVLHGNLN